MVSTFARQLKRLGNPLSNESLGSSYCHPKKWDHQKTRIPSLPDVLYFTACQNHAKSSLDGILPAYHLWSWTPTPWWAENPPLTLSPECPKSTARHLRVAIPDDKRYVFVHLAKAAMVVPCSEDQRQHSLKDSPIRNHPSQKASQSRKPWISHYSLLNVIGHHCWVASPQTMRHPRVFPNWLGTTGPPSAPRTETPTIHDNSAVLENK